MKIILSGFILFSILGCASSNSFITSQRDCKYANIIVSCGIDSMDVRNVLRLFTDSDEVVESIRYKQSDSTRMLVDDIHLRVVTTFQSAKPAISGNEYIIKKQDGLWKIASKDMWIE